MEMEMEEISALRREVGGRRISRFSESDEDTDTSGE